MIQKRGVRRKAVQGGGGFCTRGRPMLAPAVRLKRERGASSGQRFANVRITNNGTRFRSERMFVIRTFGRALRRVAAGLQDLLSRRTLVRPPREGRSKLRRYQRLAVARSNVAAVVRRLAPALLRAPLRKSIRAGAHFPLPPASSVFIPMTLICPSGSRCYRRTFSSRSIPAERRRRG